MITSSKESQAQAAALVNQKIMELQSALFFTESASLCQLPTHVVSSVGFDEEGHIWFIVPKPVQSIEAFDQEIPAKLDFFKKGTSFYVKVKGRAHLIHDRTELKNNKAISTEMHEKLNHGTSIAVKVSIQDADLVDNTPPKPNQGWIRSTRMQLSSWFF